MKRKLLLALVAGLSAFSLGVAAPSQDSKDSKDSQASQADGAARQESIVSAQLPTYPLEKCVVSGEGLHDMGEPIDMVHEGKLVRLCCKGCKKGFAKSPEKFIEKIDAAVIEQQKPSYPMKTCPVSGEPLGSMGDPVAFVYGTRLVQLCCKGCTKEAEKQPQRVLEKVDAAYMDAQRSSYPLDTCLVSGEPLEDPNDFLYGTTLVRTCCGKCEKAVRKDPGKYLPKLKAARQSAG